MSKLMGLAGLLGILILPASAQDQAATKRAC